MVGVGIKKRLLGLILLGLIVSAVSSFSLASFSNTKTNSNNTFTTASLDLSVDGSEDNLVKFNAAGFKPDDEQIETWELTNNGSIDGYLDLENISLTSNENTCYYPETSFGDTSCVDPGAGELADLTSLDMFIDYDCDGQFNNQDSKFYSGLAADIASSYELNELMTAASSLCLSAQFSWQSAGEASDSISQSDDIIFDIEFELAQTSGQ